MSDAPDAPADSIRVTDGVRVARDGDDVTITDGENTLCVPSDAIQPLVDTLDLFDRLPVDETDGLAALLGDAPAGGDGGGDACPECGATTIDGLGGRDCPACGWTGDTDTSDETDATTGP
jgi:hypothetical protein